MKVWKGKTIILIGIIHLIYGFAVFRDVIFQIISEGFFNTVQEQPLKNAAFWFIFFGFLVVILGFLVNYLERLSIALPSFLGWSLLGVTCLLVAIMPVSGAWAILLPAVGLIYQKQAEQK